MNKEIRVMGGFIEVERQPVAKILNGVDERTVREDIPCVTEEELLDAQDDSYKEGYDTGVDDGRDEANEKIDRVLDKMVKQEVITQEQADTIAEALP